MQVHQLKNWMLFIFLMILLPLTELLSQYNIMRTTNDGKTWEKCLEYDNLPVFDVVSTNKRGYFFAATAAYTTGEHFGIYRSTDNGNSWLRVGIKGEQQTDIRSITFSDSGEIYIAGGSGIYFSTDNGNRWKKLQKTFEQGCISITITRDNEIFVGTWDGVYSSMTKTIKWKQAGLKNLYVNSLTADEDGIIYAGTNKGLYYSNDKGFSWGNTSLKDLWINSVVVDSKNNVWVATAEEGAFYSIDQGKNWTRVRLDDIKMTKCISFSSSGDIYIGGANCCPVYEFNLLRSKDYGKTWLKVYSIGNGRAISNIALNDNGTICVGLTTVGE